MRKSMVERIQLQNGVQQRRHESAEAGACSECGMSRRGKGSTGGGSVYKRPREVSERMGLMGMMRPDGAGWKMERQCEHFRGGSNGVSNAWLSDNIHRELHELFLARLQFPWGRLRDA